MGLGLPRLSQTSDHTLDIQLERVHTILASALKGYGSTGDFTEQ